LYSREYNILQGTRQGGIISPWLFLVYINDLISELENSKWGIFLYNIYYGSPTSADDITLLCRLKTALDHLLDILNTFSRSWRVTFNIKKTVTMVFGEKVRKIPTPERNWVLGSLPIKEVLENTCMQKPSPC
jgi:hypothetical protein